MIFRVIALLLALTLSASAQIVAPWQAGSYQPAPSSGCTAGTFGSPDGTAQTAHNSSSATLTFGTGLTTTHCPDIIYVIAYNNSATVGSGTVTGCGLTWNSRASSNAGSATNGTQLFYAIASTTVTACTPTITYGVAGFMSGVIVAFNDIHSAAPFDSNAAIPNAPNNTTCTFTTSNADDILLGIGSNTNTTPDTGFTMIAPNSGSFFLFTEYQSVTATQSTLVATNTSPASICDAIIQGP